MPYYPTITDVSPSRWNLPTTDSDSGFDVYVFDRITPASAQVALSVIIIRNPDTVNSVNVSNIELNDLAIGAGFSLNPFTGGVLSLGGDTIQGEQLVNVNTVTGISNTEFAGATKMLKLPPTGDVTISDLSYSDDADCRVVPLYKTADIANNDIPPNSYAAFILEYKPTAVASFSSNLHTLIISSNEGNRVIPLSSSAYNDMIFSVRTGVLSSGALTGSVAVEDGGRLDLRLWPVESDWENYTGQSFYATSMSDESGEYGGWKISSHTKAVELHPDGISSLGRDFSTDTIDTGLSVSVWNGDEYVGYSGNQQINALILDDGDYHKVLKNYRLAPDSVLPLKSSNSYLYPSLERYDTTPAECRMEYKEVYGIHQMDPSLPAELADFTFTLYPSGGFYRRMTVPLRYVMTNFANASFDSSDGVYTLRNDDPDYNLMVPGANFYIDIIVTYNNFAEGGLRDSYQFASTLFSDATLDSVHFADGSISADKYSTDTLGDDDDTALAVALTSGATDATTASACFSNEAGYMSTNSDTSKSVGIRFNCTPKPIEFDSMYVVGANYPYHAINTSFEGIGGRIELQSKLDSEVSPFNFISGAITYNNLYHALPPSLNIARRVNSTSGHRHVITPSTDVYDIVSDGGTFVESAVATWYLEGTATVATIATEHYLVGAQVAAYDGIDGNSSGSVGTTLGGITPSAKPDRKLLLDKSGLVINAFTPKDFIFQKEVKYSPSQNKKIAYFDFVFTNDGDYRIILEKVIIGDSTITDVASTPATPAGGSPSWTVGTSDNGVFSSANSYINYRDNSGIDAPSSPEAYWSANTGATYKNALVNRKHAVFSTVMDNPLSDSSTQVTTVKLELPPTAGASASEDYYAMIEVWYWMDDYGNRFTHDTDDTYDALSFADSRMHKARYILKATASPVTNFEVSDSDDNIYANGSIIAFGGVNIG